LKKILLEIFSMICVNTMIDYVDVSLLTFLEMLLYFKFSLVQDISKMFVKDTEHNDWSSIVQVL